MASSGKIFRDLTQEQLLARVPKKPYFSTPEVAAIFEVTETTVFRWAGGDQLKKYESRGRGGANLYKRADIVRFVKSRYQLVPKKKSGRIRDASSRAQANQSRRGTGS